MSFALMIALTDTTADISLSSFGTAMCTFMTFVLQNNHTRVYRYLKLGARFVRNLGPENVALGRTQASLPGWNSQSCPQPVTNIPNCFSCYFHKWERRQKRSVEKVGNLDRPHPFPQITFDFFP